MAPRHARKRKSPARAAGILTFSGLLAGGGVAVAQSAQATAPEAPKHSATEAAPSLESFRTNYQSVPSTLLRPSIEPKSHVEIARELAQAKRIVAEKKAAAEKVAAEKIAAAKDAGRKVSADKASTEKTAPAQTAPSAADITPATASATAEHAEASQTIHAPQLAADVAAPAPAAATATASSGVARHAAPAVQNAFQAAPAPTQAQRHAAPAAATPASQGPSVQNAAATYAPRHSARAHSGNYNGNAVAAAARAQIGVGQDCTSLVTNSLRAVGINFHGWPVEYQSLGHNVSAAAAQPGDLIYYASNGSGGSHIAVYLGGGRAIHGGWNGGTTAEFSAYLPTASAPVFIHVDR